MAKLRVFLSHLNVEARLADALRGYLQRDFIGLVEVFVASDGTSIPVGAQWLEAVMEAIKHAQLHVILCSRDAVQRPWINYEAGAARLNGVPTVPSCHSGLTPEQLPVPLSEAEAVVLTDPPGLEKFYRRIAALLDSALPSVNFHQYCAELRGIEAHYANQRRAVSSQSGPAEPEIIKNPRVVCVTSGQFLELGFKNQLQLILDAFPQDIPHDRVLRSADLTRRLAGQRVDIFHVATYVCPRTGELYFSDVDVSTGESVSTEVDCMSAEAFTGLTEAAGARLVVISSCDSLALATTLLKTTNVIAARDMISAKAMAAWLETFYGSLREKPLVQACESASLISQAPMRLYAKQSQTPNMVFIKASGSPLSEASMEDA